MSKNAVVIPNQKQDTQGIGAEKQAVIRCLQILRKAGVLHFRENAGTFRAELMVELDEGDDENTDKSISILRLFDAAAEDPDGEMQGYIFEGVDELWHPVCEEIWGSKTQNN